MTIPGRNRASEASRSDNDDPVVVRHRGVARFPSLEIWLETEIRGWTLAETIDDDRLDALVQRARVALGDVARDDGVVLPVSALVVSGARRAS